MAHHRLQLDWRPACGPLGWLAVALISWVAWAPPAHAGFESDDQKVTDASYYILAGIADARLGDWQDRDDVIHEAWLLVKKDIDNSISLQHTADGAAQEKYLREKLEQALKDVRRSQQGERTDQAAVELAIAPVSSGAAEVDNRFVDAMIEELKAAWRKHPNWFVDAAAVISLRDGVAPDKIAACMGRFKIPIDSDKVAALRDRAAKDKNVRIALFERVRNGRRRAFASRKLLASTFSEAWRFGVFCVVVIGTMSVVCRAATRLQVSDPVGCQEIEVRREAEARERLAAEVTAAEARRAQERAAACRVAKAEVPVYAGTSYARPVQQEVGVRVLA